MIARLEVLVRRRDDPGVHGVAPRRPHRAHVLLLKDAQQLDLERGRKLRHLVEEDRPAMGRAEQTERVGHRSRERPADVAEELGLQEVGRHRPAVDRDERPAGSRGEPVNRRRHQLLPGAALALDQHRRVRRRHADDHPLHRFHRRRDADQLAHAELLAQAAPQRVDLLAKQAPLQDVVQEVAELLEDQGLREVVVRAQLQRLHRGRHGGIARHHEHLDRRIVPLEVPEELHAVHLRQVDVHDRDLEELGLEQLDGPGAGRHDHRLVAPPAEHLREELAKCVVVLHHQDVQTLHHRLAGCAGGRVSARGSPSRSTRSLTVSRR